MTNTPPVRRSLRVTAPRRLPVAQRITCVATAASAIDRLARDATYVLLVLGCGNYLLDEPKVVGTTGCLPSALRAYCTLIDVDGVHASVEVWSGGELAGAMHLDAGGFLFTSRQGGTPLAVDVLRWA